MSNFVAINAKIDAMYAKLLNDKDYDNLSSMASVSSAIEYLEKTELLKGFSLGTSISEAEEALNFFSFRELDRLTNYLTGVYRSFLLEYLREEEIDSLKKALRFLVRDRNLSSYDLSISGKNFDIAGLDVKTFVEKLKGTIYYNTLKTYVDETDELILFYMEMNLDKLYFNRIYETVKSFDKENSEEFSKIFGRKIDVTNLRWIYRGSVNYRLLPEELLNFVIFGGKYLSFESLKDMCYLDNKRAYKEIVKNTPYEILFDENGEIVDNMSIKANRQVNDFALREFNKSHTNLGHLLSFLIIFEAQIKDIKIFMEALRLGMSKSKIYEYLVNVRK